MYTCGCKRMPAPAAKLRSRAVLHDHSFWGHSWYCCFNTCPHRFAARMSPRRRRPHLHLRLPFTTCTTHRDGRAWIALAPHFPTQARASGCTTHVCGVAVPTASRCWAPVHRGGVSPCRGLSPAQPPLHLTAVRARPRPAVIDVPLCLNQAV
jgi:hypothetical protein